MPQPKMYHLFQMLPMPYHQHLPYCTCGWIGNDKECPRNCATQWLAHFSEF